MFSFRFATTVILSIGAAVAGTQIVVGATHTAVAADLTQIAQTQQMAVDGDGAYPEELGSLEATFCAADIADVYGEACDDGGRNFFDVLPLDDFAVSYALNAERTHYVVAKQLKDASVIMISDTTKTPVTCEAYNYECLAQLTDDEDLRNSTPTWQLL